MCRVILFSIMLALGSATFAPAGDELSWAGQAVMKRRPDVKFGAYNADGTERLVKLSEPKLKVLREKEGWLRVWSAGTEAWVLKTDMVLVLDAPGYYTEYLRAQPNDDWGWAMRGLAWRFHGRMENAIHDYSQAIRLNPSDAAYFNNRGNAWASIREFDKAIADYNEAIRLKPKSGDAYLNRGHVWQEKKQLDKAIHDYDEVIRLDGKEVDAYISRGDAWLAKKNFDQSMRDLDEAIRLEPKHAGAFNNRGNAWFEQKQYEKAIQDYDEAVRLDPRLEIAVGNTGKALAKLKRYAEAAACFETAILVNPLDSLYAEYASFCASCPNASFRDGTKALELARTAMRLAGDNANGWGYQSVLAAAYAEAGDFERAVKTQRAALEDKSLDAENRAKMEKRLELYGQMKPFRDED